VINGIEGIPGSGKSYEAVAFHVLPALKAGRKVITNLPLNIEAFASIDPAYRDLIQIKEQPSPILGEWDASNIAESPAFQLFEDGHVDKQPESVFTFGSVWDYYNNWRSDDGRGPLFIIDECHVSLPKDETDSAVVEWFKLHRHFNVDVLSITQSFRDINQPIARLVATLIKCRKADILGKKDYYIRKVHAGYRGAVIQTDQRKYQSQFFGLYNSHTQGLSLAEADAQDVSPFIVKFNRIKWVVLAFALIMLVWAFWPRPGQNAFGQKKVVPKIHKVAASPPTSPVAPASGPGQLVKSVDKDLGKDKDLADDFGIFTGHKVSIAGMLSSSPALILVLSISHGNSLLFTATTDELERAGYTFEIFGYCFGVLKYKDKRRPLLCDAPLNGPGAQDRPITFDSGQGRWSNDTGRPGASPQ